MLVGMLLAEDDGLLLLEDGSVLLLEPLTEIATRVAKVEVRLAEIEAAIGGESLARLWDA